VADRDGWMESLGEVGTALQTWRDGLIADLGGEGAVSAQQRAIVQLATRTYLLLESVDRWLLQQPSLVNKSKRQLFPVVLQRQQLADALARYMSALGLERRARPVHDLDSYIVQRYTGEDAGPGHDGRSADPTATGAAEAGGTTPAQEAAHADAQHRPASFLGSEADAGVTEVPGDPLHAPPATAWDTEAPRTGETLR